MSDTVDTAEHTPEQTTGAPAAPPSDVDRGALPGRALGLVRARAWDYLTPIGLVAVLAALASVLLTSINAWASPSMLRDGAFVHESTTTASLVVAGVVAVALAALTGRATLVVAL